MATKALGKLVKTAEAAGNKDRAGGLPKSFVIVVTPSSVRVYESLFTRAGSDIGSEVANWDRARLRVLSVARGGIKTTLKLRLPDGEEISCSAGTHDYTDRFVELISTELVTA